MHFASAEGTRVSAVRITKIAALAVIEVMSVIISINVCDLRRQREDMFVPLCFVFKSDGMRENPF